jgi:hypothetical protein
MATAAWPFRFGSTHLARSVKFMRDLDTRSRTVLALPAVACDGRERCCAHQSAGLAGRELNSQTLPRGRLPFRANRAGRDLASDRGHRPGVNSRYVDGGGHSPIVNRNRDRVPV